ncbi:MAG: DUF4124 domain-containing protein [Pseudomonadota bacterium]|nr:DUF4124 domain-containing protein [Pseudomonadota bacterium]
MNTTRPMPVWLLGLLLIATPALGEVYRWTGEDGTPAYSDRAIRPGAEKTQIDYSKNPTDPAEDTAEDSVESLENTAPSQADSAAQCDKARTTLAKYERASYLYREDPDGETQILSDEQYQAEVEKVRMLARKACGDAD